MLEWLLIPPVLALIAAFIPNQKLSKWEYDPRHVYYHSWLIPIGKVNRVVYHNFEHHPHMLVGGTTRFGKTVFLKSLFTSLIMANPDRVKIYIIDLKGGLEFGEYKRLPQVLDVADDLVSACKLLDEVYKEIKEQQKRFREKGYKNISDTNIRKRTFIIVDEGAETSPKLVSKENKPYADLAQIYMSEIARIGGGLGFRLIFATQYPVRDAVPGHIKMNMTARVAFKIPEQIGSRVILDDVGAEELEPIPGRAIYKLAETMEIQCPYIDDKMMEGYFNEQNREDPGDNRPTGSSERETITSDTQSRNI